MTTERATKLDALLKHILSKNGTPVTWKELQRDLFKTESRDDIRGLMQILINDLRVDYHPSKGYGNDGYFYSLTTSSLTKMFVDDGGYLLLLERQKEIKPVTITPNVYEANSKPKSAFFESTSANIIGGVVAGIILIALAYFFFPK